MSDMNQRSKVTIEDLLKLKRAERPSADFWMGFERELRQKQLTALIEKRSWWQDLPQLFVPKVYLPVGAAAILAFSLVTIRTSNPMAAENLGGSESVVPVSAVPTVVSLPTVVSSPLVNHKEHSVLAVSDRVAITTNKIQEETQSADFRDSSEESRDGLSPSARSFAANLAQLEQSQPELLNAVMGSRLSAPSRPSINSGAVVEFASLSSSNSKRSRLLAQYSDRQVSPVSSTPSVMRERISRRLGDIDYGDRFSRVGVKADQVSLKF